VAQSKDRKIILITGSTSGIGEATALALADDYDLILCGRRKTKLEKIKDDLSPKSKIKTLCFDISDKSQVENAYESLSDEWKKIDVLINNAGNAHGLDFIQEGDTNDWDNMIDINVKGLLYLSRHVLKDMVNVNKGHIINLGSIAGTEVYAKGNVYCASKFAVDAITKGMRVDLNNHNIKVSQVSPGLVNTEFSEVRFKGDKEKADSIYKGIEPLYAEDVARVIKFILDSPENVNISEVSLLPRSQASSTVVKRKS
jgi:NADP-dependent 3-hydroxy acid dehydrogenase YdfG|tara:strand:- start:210 stop:977 length:768 start_codon:yes stop_codon:yes gene_type:complete